MIKYTWRRFCRTPVPAIAVALFAAILAAVLCGLQAANEQEENNYQEICRTVPVTVSVSNLSGTSTDDLLAPTWVMDAMRLFLDAYVTDIQAKASTVADSVTIGDKATYAQELVGITSLTVAGELAQAAEDIVTWQNGYDEDVLQTGTLACILPASMIPETEALPETVQMHFENIVYNANEETTRKYSLDLTFTVAGIHQNNSVIYCPIAVVEHIKSQLKQELRYDRIGGVLIHNEKLEEMRGAALKWFAEPNLSGELTPWDYSGYNYYPYALKIDDSQLRAAEETLENSLTINRLCSILVLVLSAGAGFFIGFLLIRSRKREIVLMRTMGTPNGKIYTSFAVEQITCVLLGVLLGGTPYRWRPIGRLGIFLGIYFTGLSMALLIFLYTNLLTTIKEDE